MTATIFDGEREARQREQALTEQVTEFKKAGKHFKLVSVVVGDSPASHLYVDLKGAAAQRIGIDFEKLKFTADASSSVLIERIKAQTALSSVTGLMVQLPLPETVRGETTAILSAIDPSKDVDCLTPENLGRLIVGKPRFLPATVKAVIRILDDVVGKENLASKRVVVVGRSNIVGKPLAAYLVNHHATVTIAHSKTPNLSTITAQADILMSATGRRGLITKRMVRKGAIVIDVGEPKADVDKEVRNVASLVTPVPGGVGPLTVISLLENVVKAGTQSLTDQSPATEMIEPSL